MSRTVLFLATAAVVLAAAPLSAQRSTANAERQLDTSVAVAKVATEAAADSALRDLSRALASLMTSVQQIVTETANKPEVRLAAVQVAGRAVTLAQRALEDNTAEIERALGEASRALGAAEVAQRKKTDAAKKQ